MVVERDVLIQSVRRVLEGGLNYVVSMVAERDAFIQNA